MSLNNKYSANIVIENTNIYRKLSCMPKYRKVLNGFNLYIDTACAEAFITYKPINVDEAMRDQQEVSDIIKSVNVTYPDKLNNKIINLTASELGLDWDGDVVNFAKFVACRDYVIHNRPTLMARVVAYKILFNIQNLVYRICNKNI